MKLSTHKGLLVGCDSRTPDDYTRVVFLRETKLYWIDQYGTKYKKSTGRKPNEQWPMYRLDMESIKPL